MCAYMNCIQINNNAGERFSSSFRIILSKPVFHTIDFQSHYIALESTLYTSEYEYMCTFLSAVIVLANSETLSNFIGWMRSETHTIIKSRSLSMLYSSAHKHNFYTHNSKYAKFDWNKNVRFPSAHLCRAFRLLKRIFFFSCNYPSVTYACKHMYHLISLTMYVIICLRYAKISCAFHGRYRY